MPFGKCSQHTRLVTTAMAGLLKPRHLGRFITKAGVLDSQLSRHPIPISIWALLFWRTKTIPRSGILQTPWQSISLVTDDDAPQDLWLLGLGGRQSHEFASHAAIFQN